ncbi:MAG: menaquinone biosynthesis protein [Nitrospirae bacterium]|nr:menaquinone biosynthesis protein [Nitrospirota bacterium]MBF0533961.1 menaquinone biosynthesis protein [Nitrospirota bacterium]MBF0616120.1 menaquinone biosynthesis protein [Nitrospirota bacterium]
MLKSLKIGKINFANLFPIFHCLENDINLNKTESYEIISGVPSYLNSLIREGKIDVSPSSSIEYLRHPELYDLIKEHSVSSFGAIESILLFSADDICNLGGKTVLVSVQSETSVALLKVILSEFYGITVSMEPSDAKLAEGLGTHPAYLLIGDNALIENRRSVRINKKIYIYDLGQLWYEHTGLPFVFALWIARKDCNRKLLSEFEFSLKRAKKQALSTLSEIASVSPYPAEMLSKEMLVSYWENISYDLTEKHMQGLQLFESYLFKGRE